MSTTGLPPADFIKLADIATLSISFAALYVVGSIVSGIYSAYFGPLSSFPGPKARAFSTFLQFLSDFTGQECVDIPKLHAKYGPVVRVGPTMLSYNEGAHAWKEIYGFKKPGQPLLHKDPKFYNGSLNGVDNLITADDANHSRQRKALSNSFADRSLKDLEPMLKSWVVKLREKLYLRAAVQEPTDMLKYYNCTTFDIMADLSFNESLGMLEDGEYSPWVKVIFEGIKRAKQIQSFSQLNALAMFIVLNFIFKNKAVRAKQWEHFNYSVERVDRRLARTPERPDLWTKIIEKSDGPSGLSLGEHHSTASLFMTAGTETTATALSGTTYWLLRNPKYMAELTKEIRDAFSSLDDVTLDSIARLKYVNAVLHEGMRMYPPVPTGLPRVTPKGGSLICGKFVPQGTSVAVHQLSTYRNPECFKNPYEFHPERWLGDPEYKNDHLDALEPFSVGPRNCLGKNLAYHEMRLILVATLLSFDLALCKESADWANQKVYTLWEKKPLMCTLKEVKA